MDHSRLNINSYIGIPKGRKTCKNGRYLDYEYIRHLTFTLYQVIQQSQCKDKV